MLTSIIAYIIYAYTLQHMHAAEKTNKPKRVLLRSEREQLLMRYACTQRYDIAAVDQQ
jgi:hypothetical protein